MISITKPARAQAGETRSPEGIRDSNRVLNKLLLIVRSGEANNRFRWGESVFGKPRHS